jgi:SAM-dependent methyltransferase
MNPLFAYLHRRSREKKYALFLEWLRPWPEARILNVGVSGSSIGLAEQFESFYPHLGRVVGGGLAHADVLDYARSFPRARAVVFDGVRLPFADKSFDIVYSNAVLEHLPSAERVRRLAAEVRRVGRGWFVATPNRWYPIEPHYHLPFVQFLSEESQRWLVAKLGMKPYAHLRLLSARELRQLFPDSRILRCRVTFYPETLIAVRSPD